MTRRDLADHARDTGKIQRGQRNQAVVRAQAPGRAELGTGRSQQEQRRLGAPVSQRPQQVERGRVGPVEVLEGDDSRLRSGSGQDPGGHRRQLPSSQLFGWEIGDPAGRQRDVDERREKRRVLRGVEADQPQRSLEIGEALFGRRIRAEPLPAPFGDRMHWRVLEEL